MNQTEFDFTPSDPNVLNSDVQRLGGQNKAILDRLKKGPVTVDELSRMSRKYTSRISDLRKRGHLIRCVRQDGGNNLYKLVPK